LPPRSAARIGRVEELGHPPDHVVSALTDLPTLL
jgi:hypothetical protein